MKYLLLFSAAILFAILPSCKEKADYSLQESRIDSLETILQEADKALDADTSVLRKRAEKIGYEMNAIKIYHTREIPRELAFMLDDYRRIRKIYMYYNQNLAAMNEESGALRLQLENLRKSLLKGKFTDDNFKRFYQIEKTDVESLHAKSTDIAEKVNFVDSTFLRVSPQIEKVVKEVTANVVK